VALLDPITTPATGSQLARVMKLARQHLNMDVVFIGEFLDGRQVYRALDGSAASFGMELGVGPALEETYCQRMVTGHIPQVVPDAAAEPGVADLGAAVLGGVGAYVGVPITLPDGSLYGTFCCLNRERVADLSERDVKFMALLAELVADELTAQRLHDKQREVLNEIITGEHVDLAVQPVVAVTGELVGLEVLSRFAPGIGRPDVVFATARDLGVGSALERMVAVKASTLLSLVPKGCALGINVTPANVLELAREPAAATYPELSRFVLEITEHDAVENYAELRDCLRPLRDHGLRVAIDDTGAGYASLHHVIELQPDMLKIDRSIIEGLADDQSRRSVVRSFLSLATDIGALVCAEGVERLVDLQAAIDLGVHAAQGYLLARPSTDHADIARWAHGPSLMPTATSRS
jgi:EAL domain-containing protein (putative c-di-GMP-specific phosphodiesterase class I)